MIDPFRCLGISANKALLLIAIRKNVKELDRLATQLEKFVDPKPARCLCLRCWIRRIEFDN